MRRVLRLVIPLLTMAVLSSDSSWAVEESYRYELSFGVYNVTGGRRIDNMGGANFSGGLPPLSIEVKDDNFPIVPVFRVCQSTDGDTTYCESGEPQKTFTCSSGGTLDLPRNAPKWSLDHDIVVFMYTWGNQPACRNAAATSGEITLTYDDEI